MFRENLIDMLFFLNLNNMSVLDRINSVQALALAGLERASSNVSMIQNLRITTGQILNFAGQVRAQGLNISLQIPDLSMSYASPFLLCL